MLFFMPSTKETEEEAEGYKKTLKYRELIQNKIGSDSYNHRAAQTFNLTLKNKEITQHKVINVKHVLEQASTYDIEDEKKNLEVTEAV